MIRPLLISFAFLTFFAVLSPRVLFAVDVGGSNTSQELKNLSRSVDEIEKQRETMLENDAKIIGEVKSLQIGSHRHPRKPKS